MKRKKINLEFWIWWCGCFGCFGCFGCCFLSVSLFWAFLSRLLSTVAGHCLWKMCTRAINRGSLKHTPNPRKKIHKIAKIRETISLTRNVYVGWNTRPLFCNRCAFQPRSNSSEIVKLSCYVFGVVVFGIVVATVSCQIANAHLNEMCALFNIH